MADIRDYAYSNNGSAVFAHTAVMPTHATNDLLMWFVQKDGTTGGALPAPPGYTEITLANTSNVTSVNRLHVYYKVAASASETAPTTTSTTSDEFLSLMVAFKDINTSTPINASNDKAENSGAVQYSDAPTLTTTSNNCLIFHMIAQDGDRRPLFQHTNNIDRRAETNLGIHGGFTYQETAGVNTPPECYFVSNNKSILFSVALLNNTSDIPLYESPDTGGDLLHSSKGDPTPVTVNTVTCNGPSVTGVSANDLADIFINPGNEAIRIEAQTAVDGLFNGVELTFSAGATDFSTNSHMLFYTKRDAGNPLSEFDTIDNGGLIVGAVDSDGDWRCWEVGGSNEKMGFEDWRNCIIDISDTSDLYDSSGVFNTTNVTAAFVCHRRQSTGYANVRWLCAPWPIQLRPLTLLGGTSTNPITTTLIGEYSQRLWNYEARLQGSTELLCSVPLIMGDGTNTGAYDLSSSTIEFLKQSKTGTNRYFRHTDNFLGIQYRPKASEKCYHKNAIIYSDSPYHWNIHTGASGTADFDFNGLQVIGPGQTQINVATHTGITFDGRDEITFGAGGSLAGGCTIQNTNGTQAVTVTSQADLDKLANCTFKNNAIGISVNVATDVTTLDFSGMTFTSNTIGVQYENDHNIEFTVSNGTNLVIGDVNEAGLGTVTLDTATVVQITAPNLIDGTRVQVVDTTNGGTIASLTRTATTAAAVLTAHGFSSGDTVVILGSNQGEYNGAFTVTVVDVDNFTFTVSGSPTSPATGTMTARIEIDNSIVSGGTGYSFNYTHNGNINARMRACYSSGGTAYTPIVSTLLVTTSGASMLETQALDTKHNEYGVDGSTVTEITPAWDAQDNVNIFQINVDDPDNTFDSRRGVAWFRYIGTTAQGIREFDPEAITYSPDIRNIIVSPAIRIKNSDTVNPLVITEGLWKNSDDSLIYDTSGGSIFWQINDRVYQGPETGTSGLTTEESNKLNSIATVQAKTDQLTFTQSGVVDANIQYVNDVAVNGTGTAENPWNP